MAKHTLRSRGDQQLKTDNTIVPHNARMVYSHADQYQRRYTDGTLSREFYTITLDEASDERCWEEVE